MHDNNQDDRDDLLEMVKELFHNNFMEDVEFLNSLSGEEIFRVRYADIIIRDMLEQLIEFTYLLQKKDGDLIKEYLGLYIEEIDFNAEDLVSEYKKLASGRFRRKRKGIKEMAAEIGEVEKEDGSMPLYAIYSLLSENIHNSYHFGYMDMLEECESGGKICALTKFQIFLLDIIKERFEKVYMT